MSEDLSACGQDPGTAAPGIIESYLEAVTSRTRQIDARRIESLAAALEDVWREGRKLLLMGNGGSAATASHFANDFQKCVQLETGRALRAISLADCVPLTFAWANDSEYANIFAPQVECWAEPGDLVIGISGSGNSENVIRAIEAANRLGARTFGLAGMGGGRLASAAGECLVVPGHNMQQIEDMHTIVLHAAFTALLARLRPER